MFNIRHLFYNKCYVNIKVSLEYYPPKKKRNFDLLNKHYNLIFKIFAPVFLSLTYRAGESFKYDTHKMLIRLLKRHNPNLLTSHFIYLEKSKKLAIDLYVNYIDINVNNLLILKGDSFINFQVRNDCFNINNTLKLLKILEFFIINTSYPEGHPNSNSIKTDIELNNKKIFLGTDLSITQLVYSINKFKSYFLKITKFIVPGILLIKKESSIEMCLKCNTYITSKTKNLIKFFNKRYCTLFNIKQLINMIFNNIYWFHLFTMNKLNTIIKILSIFNTKNLICKKIFIRILQQ